MTSVVVRGWRWSAAAWAALAIGCLALPFARLAENAPPVAHSPAPRGWSALPAPARLAVSRGLGADAPRFRVRQTGGSLAARAGGGLAAAFTAGGVDVTTDRHGFKLRLGLSAVGRGGAVRAVPAVAPHAVMNRVIYAHPGIREWFANGPLGLEQGFALARRPAGSGRLVLGVGSVGAADARMDGSSLVAGGIRYGDLSVVDAGGRAVPASIQLRGRRVMLWIDDRSAAYPLRIDPLTQVVELSASDPTLGNSDRLGFSVAISADGLTVAAGATHHGGSGAVYVFSEPASGLWQEAKQTAELTASDGAVNDQLGYSVAISPDGQLVAAGAPNHGGRGAVYVFSEPSISWADTTQTAELIASDAVPGGQLGHAVAISGDGRTITAGAPAPGGAGAAYVFNEPAGGWQPVQPAAKLTAPSPATNDIFGWSVALSSNGQTLVVGAPSNAGQAYVFTAPSATGWSNSSAPAVLTANDSGTGETLGWSVAISADGRTIAAGDPAHAGRGAVYVFSQPAAGIWQTATQTAKLSPNDANADNLGWSAAISGNGDTIAAGAYSAATSDGAIYLFLEPTAGWADAHESVPPLAELNGMAADSLGTGAAISDDGGTVAGGAAGRGSADGAVFVFSSLKSTSATSVSCAPDPAPAAAGSTCTATVSDTGAAVTTTPTGRVAFHAPTPAGGSFAAGSCVLAPSAAGGAATCGLALSATHGGSYSFSARYVGDSRHLPSTANGSVTLQPAPAAVTGRATAVSSHSATLSGTINPNGVPVSMCTFDYGPTGAYGHRAACSPKPGGGSAVVPVTAQLKGLAPGTTYHYRLRAAGAGGSGVGADTTLSTTSVPVLLGNVGFVSSSGEVSVLVGCAGARSCRVELTVRRRRSVLGRRKATVPGNRGALVSVSLGHAGGRLTAVVAGASGASDSATLALMRAGRISRIGPVGFLSPGGRAGVVLTCARGQVCGGELKLTLGRSVIAGPARCAVPPGGARVIVIGLTRAGRRALAHPRARTRVAATLTPAGSHPVTVPAVLVGL